MLFPDHRCLGALGLAMLALAGLPPEAEADGIYYQLDYVPGATSTVLTVQRGSLGVSLGWSEWDTGEATTLFASYSLPVPALGPGTTLKLGPAFRHEGGGPSQAGVRAVIENYRQTDQGSLFLLGDVTSIKREYLFLAEWGLPESPVSLAVSFQGDDGDFSEQTLTLGYQIPDSPLRLRLGHRFDADKTFVGFSINTF